MLPWYQASLSMLSIKCDTILKLKLFVKYNNYKVLIKHTELASVDNQDSTGLFQNNPLPWYSNPDTYQYSMYLLQTFLTWRIYSHANEIPQTFLSHANLSLYFVQITQKLLSMIPIA